MIGSSAQKKTVTDFPLATGQQEQVIHTETSDTGSNVFNQIAIIGSSSTTKLRKKVGEKRNLY